MILAKDVIFILNVIFFSKFFTKMNQVLLRKFRKMQKRKQINASWRQLLLKTFGIYVSSL